MHVSVRESDCVLLAAATKDHFTLLHESRFAWLRLPNTEISREPPGGQWLVGFIDPMDSSFRLSRH
jgi:hypothetical protein